MTLKEFRALRAASRPRTAAEASKLTVRIADMLKAECPPDVPWTHFPAGETRDERTGARLKAMGLKPGWPDFLFVLPGGRLGGIEIKAEAGRLSSARREWRADALAQGARWAECRTLGGVRETLRAWGVVMGGPPGGAPLGNRPQNPFRNGEGPW